MEAFLDRDRHEDVNISGCFCGSIVPFQCETTICGSG